MASRLDEERLEILRSWGVGLSTDSREELRAAGKAISVLIDEIDRLQVDLWNARVDRYDAAAAAADRLGPGINDALRARLAQGTTAP
jgi:hypothetical protein